ncbi:MAG: YjjG family noncanonical pyrimidine nucleotidase [Clostridia bacterium]|nr:YjjG family noncanonical pyrimidine nucleotidase [Clostridia bacterium]
MAYSIALFDADNTLLDFSRAEHDALCECLSARGISTDEDTVALYSAINDSHWKRLERGETTRSRLRVERFTEFFSAVGYSSDPVAMADDYVEALSRQSHLIDGALELIQSLYGRCGLYIITNGITSVQKSRFGRCPLAPHFDRCFISEEMGFAKPDKRFFDLVKASVPNFTPEETIVIGDSLSSDIKGGINAGLATCWFNPNGHNAPSDMDITYIVSRLSDIRAIIFGE